MKELLKALKIEKSNNDKVSQLVDDLFKAEEPQNIEDAAIDAVDRFYIKKSSDLKELLVRKLDAGEVQGDMGDIDSIITELKDLNPDWE